MKAPIVTTEWKNSYNTMLALPIRATIFSSDFRHS